VIAGVEDGTWKKRTNENGRKEQVAFGQQQKRGYSEGHGYISSLATNSQGYTRTSIAKHSYSFTIILPTHTIILLP